MSSKSDELFCYLEGAIIEGSLRSGARLPAERRLANDFALSRTAVREVIQRLKAKGWLVSKRGGGHYVSHSLHAAGADPVMGFLQSLPESSFDLLEFRHTIEGDCAYYAALRANDLDKQALSGTYQMMTKAYKNKDLEQVAKADAEFHLVIAEASHNLVYLHLMKTLFDVVKDSVFVNVGTILSREQWGDQLMRQHGEIYDAIIHGQPTTAKNAAQRHITYVEEVLSDLSKETRRLERSERRYS